MHRMCLIRVFNAWFPLCCRWNNARFSFHYKIAQEISQSVEVKAVSTLWPRSQWKSIIWRVKIIICFLYNFINNQSLSDLLFISKPRSPKMSHTANPKCTRSPSVCLFLLGYCFLVVVQLTCLEVTLSSVRFTRRARSIKETLQIVTSEVVSSFIYFVPKSTSGLSC